MDVQIIVPAKSDNIAVQKASYPTWRPLMEAGIDMWEYLPALYHPKLMIVDDAWSFVGSTNVDGRSLRHNDEADLHVLSKDFAAQLVSSFERDKLHSRKLALKDLKDRNEAAKLLDYFFRLFRTEL